MIMASGYDQDTKLGDDEPLPQSAQVTLFPDEVWECISVFLHVRDVLSLLSVNRQLHFGLGMSSNFWEMLSIRDGLSRQRVQEYRSKQPTWKEAKYKYLLYSHIADPTRAGGGVKWYPVRPYGPFGGISDREGHLSCVLSRKARFDEEISELEFLESIPCEGLKDHFIVITGGFTDDDSVYLIHTEDGGCGTDETSHFNRLKSRWKTKRIDPVAGKGPSFVYGATLTSLPTLYSVHKQEDCPPTITAEMRAIRFGGFRAGGYSNETSRVSMLTIKQQARVQKRPRRGKREREIPTQTKSNGQFYNSESQESHLNFEWAWDPQIEVNWSDVPTTGMLPSDHETEASLERDFLSRAYHTSTLLLDRYLVVIGGMKSMESVMNEAILDTYSWTWIDPTTIISCADRPSGRHGHSVIVDATRNRLVLFGGGSGSDLLRSGQDNSEVWGLQLGRHWHGREKLEESFPWTWKKLYNDTNAEITIESESGAVGSVEDTDECEPSRQKCSRLSPAETLCLGRCHHGIKVSRDTALLFFGSGRPSTNATIAYDLAHDEFFRSDLGQADSLRSPRSGVHVKGCLPKPRFTGVAAYLEDEGYIVTHGGYCSQDHDTLGTMDVLDLAPSFVGRPGGSPSFDRLTIDQRRVSYDAVSDSQAQFGRRDPAAALQRMLRTIVNTPRTQREEVARTFLSQMETSEIPTNREAFSLISMIADGNAVLVTEENDAG